MDTPVAREGHDRFTPPSLAVWIALLLTVAVLGGSIGWFIGARNTRPGATSVDVGFLYDMIAHHEQAQTLSKIELANGAEEAAQVFAREILLFQSYEIGLMEHQLNDWARERGTRPGGEAMGWMDEPVDLDAMPGLASEQELDALSAARGRDADALFIALMQDHHRGGVHMAAYAAANAEDDFVRDIAGIMARNQQTEIVELEAARQRAGLPEQPPGYTADTLPDDAADHEGHT